MPKLVTTIVTPLVTRLAVMVGMWICVMLSISQAAAVFAAGRPLATARYAHTATLLPNGKVLVAGGYNGSTWAASAELYDPATGNWSATGSLATARQFHTATLLPNGKVLVAGGINSGGASNPLASAELYDPAANNGAGAWTPTGALINARRAHTATLLPNGMVLVTGGINGSGALASVELYDPAANSGAGAWATTASIVPARFGHTATLLPNGKVLVAGGFNGTDGYLHTSALYDPANNTWSATGLLANGSRHYHTATLLPNGKVLIAGGNNGGFLTSAELYDPAFGTWTASGSLITARYLNTATLLPNGQVLVAGGFNGNGAIASAELYDPAGNGGLGNWAAVAGGISTARYGHTATLLANGTLLVAGGYTGSSNIYLASTELYDPAVGAWAPGGTLANARRYHTATLLTNGKLLVAGGNNNGALASAELYDPATDTWAPTGSLAIPRVSHTATLLPNGKVLVAGGGQHQRRSRQCGTLRSRHWNLDRHRPAHRRPLSSHRDAAAHRQGARLGGAGEPYLCLEYGTLRSHHRHLDGHRPTRQRSPLSHRDAAAQRQGARRGGN